MFWFYYSTIKADMNLQIIIIKNKKFIVYPVLSIFIGIINLKDYGDKIDSAIFELNKIQT